VILPGDDAAHGFRTEYYGDVDFKGPVVLNRTEPVIDHNQYASITLAHEHGIPDRHFSVRWTAKLVAPETGSYVLTFTGAGSFRVFVAGKKLIEYTG